MKIALVNTSAKVADSDLWLIARACNRQLQHTVGPAYGKVPMPVQFFPGKTVTPDWNVIVLKDQGSDPQALGFHTESGGIISGEIEVGTILGIAQATVLGDKSASLTTPSVASVTSHEVCELFVDPFCQLYADGKQVAQGQCYAYECCDPVESGSFFEKVDSTFVQLSDVVFPAWFDIQNNKGPFNFLQTVRAPFTLDIGGYMVVRNAPGSEQQVFGENFPDSHKLLPKNRVHRRMTAGRTEK